MNTKEIKATYMKHDYVEMLNRHSDKPNGKRWLGRYIVFCFCLTCLIIAANLGGL